MTKQITRKRPIDLQQIARAVFELPNDEHLKQRMHQIFWNANLTRKQLEKVRQFTRAMYEAARTDSRHTEH